MLNRRDLIKTGLGAGAGLALGRWGKWGSANAAFFNQSPNIPLFKTALRGVGPGGIPVAVPGFLGGFTKAPVTGVSHYEIGIIQFQDQICPPESGLGPTKLWGYAPAKGLGGYIKPTHLSGLIVGKGRSPGVPGQRRSRSRSASRTCSSSTSTSCPSTRTIPGAEQAINRTAVHLHGGLVPWISDGGPFDWFDPYGRHGASFLNNKVLNPLALPGSAEYYYPLNQSARFMWYHDHAVGITRLNAYAGIASGMLIRDTFEAGLINKGLPNYVEAGGNEIPLVIQDKIFVGTSHIHNSDPTWPGPTAPGSLWYAHVYDPDAVGAVARRPDAFRIRPASPSSSATRCWSTAPSSRRPPSRRAATACGFLNACNARFLNLQLYVADGSPNGITLDPHTAIRRTTPFVNAATGDSSFLQIGTEGGFLAHPVKVPCNQPLIVPLDSPIGIRSADPSKVSKSLLVAPAERPDVIVDFSTLCRAEHHPLQRRARPVPGWRRPVTTTSRALRTTAATRSTAHDADGFGPNTRVLMRFNVVAASGAAD